MSLLIRLCRPGQVAEGMPVAVNPPDFPALAVYRVGEDYFVTDNLCTHGRALLTDGFQDGDTIHCPFHGGAFVICSGEPAAFPCQDPLRTYPVELDDDWIAIRVTGGTKGD